MAAARELKEGAGRLVNEFTFKRETCLLCPLLERCVRSKVTGRTVTLNYYEDEQRAARQRQETDEFNLAYRERPKVERKIAELAEHGLRQARYVGRKKKQLQALWTAAVVNLKRLFKLAKGDVTVVEHALAKLLAGERVLTVRA